MNIIYEDALKFLKTQEITAIRLLVDEYGKILLEQENIEITGKICTGHAETTLAERASHLYSKEFL